MRTLDASECAEFLKIDRSTVLELAGNGVIPGAKIGRAWVFLEDDLVAFLRARVREQSRERLARTRISQELESSTGKGAVSPLVARRRHARRRTLPTLPELVSQVAAAEIGVST